MDGATVNNTQALAQQLFGQWNGTLQTGDPETVAALYTEEADFLPTVANHKSGRAGAEDYFTHFCAKSPFGTIVKESVQAFGDSAIRHSGLYDFELDDGEGGRQIVSARFTFIWVRNGDDWMIDHHHSSVLPEKA